MRNLSEEEGQNWKIYQMLNYNQMHHQPFLSHNDKNILHRTYLILYRETEEQISELINFAAVVPIPSNSHMSLLSFSVSVSIPITLFPILAVAYQEK